jgi:ribosomal protein L20A (L18A)
MIDKVLQEIGRRYVVKRQQIALNWQWEFDTEENRKIMNEQIKECET